MKLIVLTFFTIICVTNIFSAHYTVKSGDTAYGICRKFGISFSRLKKYNRNKNLNKILPGQKIYLPGKNIENPPVSCSINALLLKKPVKSTNNVKVIKKQYSINYYFSKGYVLAAAKGKILYAGNINLLGKVVFIDHGNNIFTVYKIFNGKIKVKKGQRVNTGGIIATAKRTNKKITIKFHLLKGNIPVNPERFIK